MLDDISLILSGLSVIFASYWVYSAWQRYKEDKKNKK